MKNKQSDIVGSDLKKNIRIFADCIGCRPALFFKRGLQKVSLKQMKGRQHRKWLVSYLETVGITMGNLKLGKNLKLPML